MSGSVPLKRLAELRVERRRSDADGLLTLEVVESGTGRLLADPWDSPVEPPHAGVAEVEAGDVLFGKLRPYLAKVVHVTRPAYASTELLCLRPNTATDPRWFFYRMIARPTVEWAAATSEGTKMPRTSWERLGEFHVHVPALSKQRAIADYLDTETARIDALIAKKRRLADLLRERARTQITELFDQVQAEEVHLGRFVTSLAQGESPHSDGRPAEGEERGVLKLSSVKDGLFQPFENKALPDGVAVDALTPATGDLLVTRANTPEYVGDACVVEMDFPYLVIPDLIYRIRLSPELDPEYAALCLRQPRQRGLLSAAARGTSQSMVKLRGDDIRSIPIPFPDFGTQRLIATQARAMRQSEEQLCSRLTRQIALLAEHRQALITAAVTGELEIPGAA